MSQFYGIQGLLYLLQSVFPFCLFQKNVPLIVRKIVLVSKKNGPLCWQLLSLHVETVGNDSGEGVYKCIKLDYYL
jgi:hypothetical protein